MNPSEDIQDEGLLQAMAVHRQGRIEEAKHLYREFLRRFPQNPVALQWLATAMAQTGDDVAAMDLYGRALKLDPGYAEAYRNQGNVLHRLGRFSEALDRYDQSLRIQPNQPAAYNNRGNTLKAMQQWELALASYSEALALKPDYTIALKNRGIVLRVLKRLEEALESYSTALAVDPEDAEAWNYRGNVLRELDRPEEALADYDRALVTRPRYAEAAYNRSIALRDLLRIDDAIASCDLAISIQSNHADAHWNKAELLILRGDYVQGWRLFEWRWKSLRYGRAFRELGKPLWLGDADVRGKTVLVNIDGGFGDTLQFCRYLPLLAERGARVFLETQPSLMVVLRASFGAEIEFASNREPLPDFDLHCPVMSLPGAFACSLDQLPATRPYLQAPPAHLEKWALRLGPKKRPRIGIVCSGSLDHANDRHRSIPMQQMAPIVSEDAEFHCLQKEIREADRAAFASLPIKTWEAELLDYADTAALVMQMDLVISVDTSVAHLAGALGKKVWVLLPHAPEMRWMLEREDSPWYPGVMRLFRQLTAGDWTSTLMSVRAELSAL